MTITTQVNTVLWATLALFAAVIPGILGASTGNDESDIGDSVTFYGGMAVAAVAVVVLVVVVAICVEKRIHVETMDRGPPYWTKSLVFKDEYNGGLSMVSDGLTNQSPFHVVRERLGQAVTDGARWQTGFTEGKHVFEVVWPVGKRGINSSIGVGTQEVPIKKPGRVTLVGHHSQSWGYDLSSRKMVHTNVKTGNFQKQFPDRFFVYLDMDGGKIGFGEDIKALGNNALFYGNLVNNIQVKKTVPMHLMIGICKSKESVEVYYLGTATPQGGFSLVPPEPTVQVVTTDATAPPAEKQDAIPTQAVY